MVNADGFSRILPADSEYEHFSYHSGGICEPLPVCSFKELGHKAEDNFLFSNTDMFTFPIYATVILFFFF